jgi:hypothetical protein
MVDLTDIFAIRQLVARFANSFDLKDWPALAECLADELETDYSDLRGSPAETMSRERFLHLRHSALQALRTHHLTGNVEIKLNQNEAEARVSMVIYRRAESGEIFNTHCLYMLGLERVASRWVINSIVQKVLMSDGERRIHKGVQQ